MRVITNDELTEYITEIKSQYFSKNNFPKFVIGTGLSISYNVAGMETLSEDFDEYFQSEIDFSELWSKVSPIIQSEGLESGLQAKVINESPNGDKFVDCITYISAKRVLRDTKENIEHIKDSDRGFMKLISYLSRTVSVNEQMIDIMTPNYDLIIELICEELGVGIIDGFSGEYYQTFIENELSEPQEIFRLSAKPYVRLMKPHGSINWVSTTSRLLHKVNDFSYLSEYVNELQIIPPGVNKYEKGMTGAIFSNNREIFNDILRSSSDCPLVIYGYGFNDRHFNINIFKPNKKLLVISFSIKEEILDELKKNSNAVAFYQENGVNYMLYKTTIYEIEREMWDMDELVSQMVA